MNSTHLALWILCPQDIKIYAKTILFKGFALMQESVQKLKETQGKMSSVAYYLVNAYSLCVQFAEKFQEFKEAARLAKEKSQEKMELTSTPSQVCVMGLFSCVSLLS